MVEFTVGEGGRSTSPGWPGMYSPFPPMLYVSPLKIGESCGADAHFDQSQYYNSLGVDFKWNIEISNRLVSSITTLGAECIFVMPDIVPVPSQKGASEMDEQCLVLVGSYKIIELFFC
jgi:hypothetical protein